MSRPQSMPAQELALAYELRQEGYKWKVIARGLGCCPDSLYRAIRRAETEGIDKWLTR